MNAHVNTGHKNMYTVHSIIKPSTHDDSQYRYKVEKFLGLRLSLQNNFQRLTSESQTTKYVSNIYYTCQTYVNNVQSRG